MFGQLVSMASSVISSSQLPDPSEVGLFDTPQKPRQRSYQFLSDNYTLVACDMLPLRQSYFLSRAFELGNESTALYHVAILLDPISEAAQKWSSLVKVRTSATSHSFSSTNSVKWLSNIPEVYIKCYLNPPKYKEVCRMYAWVLISTN